MIWFDSTPFYDLQNDFVFKNNGWNHIQIPGFPCILSATVQSDCHSLASRLDVCLSLINERIWSKPIKGKNMNYKKSVPSSPRNCGKYSQQFLHLVSLFQNGFGKWCWYNCKSFDFDSSLDCCWHFIPVMMVSQLAIKLFVLIHYQSWVAV